jgi:acyl-CoA synthetase (AMP-forming)/AMP-acid ligase II
VQRRWLDATGVDLRQGYGLTEASPVCLFNRLSLPNVLGTIGQQYPGIDVAIRDADTFAPLGDGEVGEICVRGGTVFQGYVHARGVPEPRGLEVRDSWLRTGDLGVRRPDGLFEFRGSKKRMFTRNGFDIYPRELEMAIAELPGVRRVLISAAPDADRENSIVADVEGDISTEEVRLWCAARLGAYKQPSVINISL